jgi:hypothetical protein
MRQPEDGQGASAEGGAPRQGFPTFRHAPWTVEGEIERFGAFGRGAAKVHGPKRWLAVLLVLAIVASAIVAIFQIIV